MFKKERSRKYTYYGENLTTLETLSRKKVCTQSGRTISHYKLLLKQSLQATKILMES